jgi:hypothetical protein
VTNDWTNSVDRGMVKFTKNQGLIEVNRVFTDERTLGVKVSKMTAHHFLADSAEQGDCYLIARKPNGDAYGLLYVPDFSKYGPDTMVGVRLIGHMDAEWHGPYTKAEAETFREFELFDELRRSDIKKVMMKTLGSGDIASLQVSYTRPCEDYPMDDKARSLIIPLGKMLVRVKK